MKKEIDYYKLQYYKFMENMKSRRKNNNNSSFIAETKPQP